MDNLLVLEERLDVYKALKENESNVIFQYRDMYIIIV